MSLSNVADAAHKALWQRMRGGIHAGYQVNKYKNRQMNRKVFHLQRIHMLRPDRRVRGRFTSRDKSAEVEGEKQVRGRMCTMPLSYTYHHPMGIRKVFFSSPPLDACCMLSASPRQHISKDVSGEVGTLPARFFAERRSIFVLQVFLEQSPEDFSWAGRRRRRFLWKAGVFCFHETLQLRRRLVGGVAIAFSCREGCARARTDFLFVEVLG